MKKKDKKDIREYQMVLRKATQLRTFPNGRNLDIFDSIAINQIGKAIDIIERVLRMVVNKEGSLRKRSKVISKMREFRLKMDKEVLGHIQ